MKKLILSMVVVLSDLTQAGVYRCETKAGISYQELPCDGVPIVKKQLISEDLVDSSATKQGTASKAQSTSQLKTTASMNEAYRKYMAEGDYSRAAAFATTDFQRTEIQRRLAQQDRECKLLAIRVKEAEVNSKNRGGVYKTRAEALQAEYGMRCP